MLPGGGSFVGRIGDLSAGTTRAGLGGLAIGIGLVGVASLEVSGPDFGPAEGDYGLMSYPVTLVSPRSLFDAVHGAQDKHLHVFDFC